MIDKTESIVLKMAAAQDHEVIKAIKLWALETHKRQSGLKESLIRQGWEVVECDSGAALTPDGRPIYWMRNTPLALRPEVHAERLAAAFASSKKAPPEPETRSVAGTESLSHITCPKCGDALQHTAVCSKCAAGQRGYRHRYACVCGAIEIISQEAL